MKQGEGMRMSNKAKKLYLGVVAVIVAAVVVPAGLLSAQAATSAPASTAACGPSCSSPWNELLGSGEVLAASGSSGVDMAAASTTSTAEDFTETVELENVQEAAQQGLISAKWELNYSADDLVEFQYAPGGTPKDECIGDLDAGNSPDDTYYFPTTSVGLVQCGFTTASLWILDNDGSGNEPCDLINVGYEASYTFMAPYNNVEGAESVTSPFAEPYVLTASSGGALDLAPLSELNGNVSTSQEWNGMSPVVQAALKQSAALRAKATASG
jgi:hypothetical protein